MKTLIKYPAILFLCFMCNYTHAETNSLIIRNLQDLTIIRVTYSFNGAESGVTFFLDITKDSIKYSESHFSENKVTTKKTSSAFWQELNDSIDLKNFDKIQSTPIRAIIDGHDFVYTIETQNHIHKLVNGDTQGSDYISAGPLFVLLNKIISEINND